MQKWPVHWYGRHTYQPELFTDQFYTVGELPLTRGSDPCFLPAIITDY